MNLLAKSLTTVSLVTIFATSALASGQSLIPYVSEEDAKGEVKKIYGEVKETFGMIPAPIKQHSVSPELLRNHWGYFKATAKNKNFDPKFLAIMRMSIATSGAFQKCDYCVDGNAMVLESMFKMPASEVSAIQKNPEAAQLVPKEKIMLNFLLTSTTDPKSLNQASFDELRKLGWSDKDIFEGIKMATQMVAAIYMVNTLKIPNDFGTN